MTLLEEFKKFAQEFMENFHQYQKINDNLINNLHKTVVEQQMQIDTLQYKVTTLSRRMLSLEGDKND